MKFITVEQEAQLIQVAARTGTDPEQMVKSAALRLLEEGTPCDPPVVSELPILHLDAMQSLSRVDIC